MSTQILAQFDAILSAHCSRLIIRSAPFLILFGHIVEIVVILFFEYQFTVPAKARLSESGHLTFKSPQILRGVSTSPEPVSMENNDAVIQLFYFNSKSQM